MPKSVFGGAHKELVQVLRSARGAAGVTQVELARRLGKDQSFVSLIEGGQRRVDILEFCAIARAMNLDPARLFAEVVARLPERFDI